MNMGGVTTSVINLCNELVARGDQVDFLNMGEKNEVNESKISPKVSIKRISGIASYWQLGIKDLKKTSFLHRCGLIPLALLKKVTNSKGLWLSIIFNHFRLKNDYDMAVAFKQCAPCYYFALNCVNAKKKVGFIHGEIDYMGNISSWDCYFSKFDKIACVSNAVKVKFAKKYFEIKDKFCTVYNMIDIEKIKALSKEDCSIEMNDDEFNILTVARIENSHKRIERIPKCCKKLLGKGINNFHWYVVGEGVDLEENVKLAKELGVDTNLTFCGALDNPYPMFEKASCFVLTSETESFGIVVLEALALKTPVVATNYAALKEILKDTECGLISSQNVDDLTEKIALLANDSNLYDQIMKKLCSYKITNDTAYYQFIDLFY